MSAFMKDLDLKPVATSTLHIVWEQAYRNFLKTQAVIMDFDLESARKYADDVVNSVRKCYHE